MKIFHHVALGIADEEEKKFRQAGIEFQRSGAISAFDLTEDDTRWRSVACLIKEHDGTVLDTVTTEFSIAELDAAQFVGLLARSNRGYPQPQDNFRYLSATYDVLEYCHVCRVGKRQKSPFQVKGEQDLKQKDVLQLNWTFDENFVALNTGETLFRPFDIGCLPVIHSSTGREIHSVVQLKIAHTKDLDLGRAACEE